MFIFHVVFRALSFSSVPKPTHISIKSLSSPLFLFFLLFFVIYIYISDSSGRQDRQCGWTTQCPAEESNGGPEDLR
jgi:hypothetical protein